MSIWKVQKSINRKEKITHNHHVETTTLITLLIAHFTSMQLNKFMCRRPTPRAHFPEFRSSHIICTQPAFGWPEISANEHSYLQCTQMFLLMTMRLHKFLRGSYESGIQSFTAEGDLREWVYIWHLSSLLLLLTWWIIPKSPLRRVGHGLEPFSRPPSLSEKWKSLGI